MICGRVVLHCGNTTAMRQSRASGALLALVALFGCLRVRSDGSAYAPSRMNVLPRLTLWAWERREDLRGFDPKKFAIAYLDQTLTIDGTGVRSQPRRDPVAFSASAKRMPVIRIEVGHGALLDDVDRADAVRAFLNSAREPGIAALQIDFDATRSQRQFYRDLILDVRRQMPVGLPLSITALASWCSWDDWLRGLPVDEAVPMMFQMEPDRRRAAPDVDDFRIREPLCRGAVGVSTGEPWPSELEGKRIYVFAEHGWEKDGWRRDLPVSLETRLP